MTKMTSRIREMQLSDSARLSEIYLEQRRQTFYWTPPECFLLEDFTKDTEGERIYVAEIMAENNQKLVGFVSLWLADHFIHHLYIDKEFQRLGYGRMLLQKCQEVLGLPLRLKCLQKNTPAVNFYQHCGWRIESGPEDSLLGPYLNMIKET
jgi:ribosomal protein S18 acetylase RimI-like enzyme